ncbi:LysR substrate-binding domain-containing protein [Devosia sp.]|jgi:DNA-binding transcriptional LysR family regulator|uniref:LysR substrate-binding domain-containing protein n=1 Tax=Devosia sp. TaxID=1871048 RepID=UPI003EF076AF
MPLPLPSLPSLRSFESSARLESFSKAANELNLSQAAISQQIRHLEDRVGGALFLREARRVTLTELGKLYLGLTADALRTMESAFETARALARPNALVLKTTPTFAAFWLLSRLPRFQQLWPSASLTVTAVEPSGQMDSLGDLTITTGQEQWGSFLIQKLFDINLVAVASPAVAQRTDLGRFLAGQTDAIIHTIRRLDDWGLWCAGAGVPPFTLDRGTILINSVLSYAAAEKGMGIVIAEEAMIAEQLARNELVKVHSARVSTGRGYYLLEPQDRTRRPIVDAFVQWIQQELAETKL